MASFVLFFFPLDVLDEIWDLIESVSEGFLTYFYRIQDKVYAPIKLAATFPPPPAFLSIPSRSQAIILLCFTFMVQSV